MGRLPIIIEVNIGIKEELSRSPVLTPVNFDTLLCQKPNVFKQFAEYSDELNEEKLYT